MKKKRIGKLLAFLIIFTMLPATSAMAASAQCEQSLFMISSLDINKTDYADLLSSKWIALGPGGRQEITLGTHNDTHYILAQFTKDTWVQYYDKDWALVWEGSFGPGVTHQLMCTSKVYRISIYLPNEGFVNYLQYI